MRKRGILSSRRDLCLGIAGFISVIAVVDSGGIAQWADRLDVGALRSAAVPLADGLDARLRRLGFDRLRAEALAELGRAGWSDDPDALAFQLAAPVPEAAMAPNAPPKVLPAPAMVRPPPTAPQPAAPPAGPAPIAAAVPAVTTLPPLAYVPPGRARTVALVGDSMMAVGLSDVLLRETAADRQLVLVKAFRSGTGLARPDVFNWMKEYPAMLGAAHPDLVIVAIGANDTQGFVDAGGHVLAFGTPAWIAAYQARVGAFMAMLSGSARQVVWVGLPPMRAAVYDAHVAALNRITFSVVDGHPNAAWWNPAPYIGDGQGQFRDLGEVERPNGRRTIAQLRAPDGIHLSDDGAGLLTRVLVPWLEPLPLPPPAPPGPG